MMKKASPFFDMQRTHMNDAAHNNAMANFRQSWLETNTIDFWRHDRMYATVAPIAQFYNKKKWLTVGDGRYGLDALRLNQKYNVNVFPTDISEEMLKESKKMGMIEAYGIENTEALSFNDDAFDIVFCKEAFHHFPRPMIGLYEMIRVATEAVILIEPNDVPSIPAVDKRKYVKSACNLIIGKLLGRNTKPYLPQNNDQYYNVPGSYEPSGNYIYSLSNRELNKVVHALNLGGMAFYPFNDVYQEGVEFEKADLQNELFKTIQKRIHKLDAAHNHNICATIIFINQIDEGLKKDMLDVGFVFPNKTDNPFLS